MEFQPIIDLTTDHPIVVIKNKQDSFKKIFLYFRLLNLTLN